MTTFEADHPLFARALDAGDRGDLDALRGLLADAPELVRARVTSATTPYEGYFHAATLLHHVAGNPDRGPLPPNVVDVARALLEAGADPDAGCGGGPEQPTTGGATTLGLVASGARAHLQGLTEPLIDVMLDHGATLDPDGGMWGSTYHVVEHRGQRDVARLLHDRGVRVDLPYAAALGRLDLVRTFFDDAGDPVPDAGAIWARTVRGGAELSVRDTLDDALLAAATNGWPEVVEELLARGARIDAVRPWGPFPITPLHGAAWAGWPEVVTLLLDRGGDATLRDAVHDTTPRGWAEHCDRTEAVTAFERAGVQR